MYLGLFRTKDNFIREKSSETVVFSGLLFYRQQYCVSSVLLQDSWILSLLCVGVIVSSVCFLISSKLFVIISIRLY